jgi:hypothetical protein
VTSRCRPAATPCTRAEGRKVCNACAIASRRRLWRLRTSRTWRSQSPQRHRQPGSTRRT